jgi:hypothetical protein
MREVISDSAWRLNNHLQQYFSSMSLAEIAGTYFKRCRAGSLRLCIGSAVSLLVFCMSPRLRASIDSSAEKSTVTIDQYEAELDRLASAVSRLPDHKDEIGVLREALPSGWVVTAEGRQFEVSSEWIAGALKDVEENLSERKARSKELAAQLQQMRGEAERLSGTAPSVDGDTARGKLEHILSGREFLTVRNQSWLSRIWNQVGEWIDWILEHTIGRLMDKGPVRTLVLWTLIGGVFLLIAVWVVRILTRMARSEALRVEGTLQTGRNWRDWAQEAFTAARGGDYRTALHSAYWAGVYRMADLGAWQLDRARTPREYLRLLADHPAVKVEFPAPQTHPTVGHAPALAALTRSMESAWYGYVPATQQDFESAIEQLETLGCKLRSTAQTANS